MFFARTARCVGCLLAVLLGLGGSAVRAQDHLLFCNDPEKIRMPGAYADAHLIAGRTYTIFFHYKNVSSGAGRFVVALQGSAGVPLRLFIRKGVADPQRDPPLAGRQAMARFLSARDKIYVGNSGGAHFGYQLGRRQIASGILSVKAAQDTRLRIYYRHNQWTVPGARTVAVEAPRREVDVALSADPGQTRQRYRIGQPEQGMSRHLDGTYGMLYAFKVAAPQGSRVRVSFSPRGGKAGLVGSLNGSLRQSRIVPPASWKVFCETVVGKNGVVSLTTAPFGGVFYPVELLFQLL